MTKICVFAVAVPSNVGRVAVTKRRPNFLTLKLYCQIVFTYTWESAHVSRLAETRKFARGNTDLLTTEIRVICKRFITISTLREGNLPRED